ncbi:TRAP transporter substrate-binding protein [Tissierella sp. Yu-01]|uniref:TRAP transporter substrate-binding protein n=1 Tax=Tissierella sp. Yu-01 TaxID=3035694 RepID=UPI00240D9333|nr:TRAP transporter substrate-binding protein [Tissierella sp. Yu-01]WFA08652.1 TRAP transporter substrate-binding protein [Tissierella sp. Yu-01]
MKRIIAVLMSMIMMFTFTACGEDTATSNSNQTPNDTEEKIVIRVGTTAEPDGHYVKGLEQFKSKVEEYTQNRVEVQIFPSAQLGNERDLVEGVGLGTLEMAISSSGPLPNFSKDFLLFDLPFIITDREIAYEVMDGEVGQSILSSLESSGIKGLGFWENGFRHISNDKKEILVPEDVAGMKIRTMENPIHIETFKLLKSIPTPMGWSEVFTALQQGTIDGQENPLIIFDTNKLEEAQKYISLTGHFYSPAVTMINKATFDNYPEDIQEAILRAEKEAKEWEREYSQSLDKELIETIKGKGVTISEVDKVLWQEACQPVYDLFSDQINPEYIKALTGK